MVTVPLLSGVVAIAVRGIRFNGSVVVVLPGDESGEVMVGPSPFERRLTRALAGRGVGFMRTPEREASGCAVSNERGCTCWVFHCAALSGWLLRRVSGRLRCRGL